MLSLRHLLAAGAALVFLNAWSRDNDAGGSPGDGYWILGTRQYDIKATERSNNSGYFILSGQESAASSNILQVYFSVLPVSSGKYKVVPFEDNVPLSSGEIGIKVRIPATGTYSSTGIRDNGTWLPCPDVDVTLNARKIKVVIPEMTTLIYVPTYLDTVFLQGLDRKIKVLAKKPHHESKQRAAIPGR
jgi:hypothetical protein